MKQFDLFEAAPPARAPWPPDGEAERLGWERRILSDLPVTAYVGGFTGAICARLVAKGLATETPAGFMGPPTDLDGNPVTMAPDHKGRMVPLRHRAEDFPQSRYEITAAGLRAIRDATRTQDGGPDLTEIDGEEA